MNWKSEECLSRIVDFKRPLTLSFVTSETKYVKEAHAMHGDNMAILKSLVLVI